MWAKITKTTQTPAKWSILRYNVQYHGLNPNILSFLIPSVTTITLFFIFPYPSLPSLSTSTYVLHFRHLPVTYNEGRVQRRNQSFFFLPFFSHFSLTQTRGDFNEAEQTGKESVGRGPERPGAHGAGIGA